MASRSSNQASSTRNDRVSRVHHSALSTKIRLVTNELTIGDFQDDSPFTANNRPLVALKRFKAKLSRQAEFIGQSSLQSHYDRPFTVFDVEIRSEIPNRTSRGASALRSHPAVTYSITASDKDGIVFASVTAEERVASDWRNGLDLTSGDPAARSWDDTSDWRRGKESE